MEISAHVLDGTGWIVFNRPQARNAISKAMWHQIPLLLEQLRTQGAHVCIFRGQGGAFAAGADLAELAQLDSKEKASEHWLSIRNALNAVAQCSLPVVAMIEGPCMGGGCLLAAACDLRYSTGDSTFSVPVAQLGIKLDDDNLARLLALVGKGRALELLITGQVIDASKAEQIGLVNAVTASNPELEALVQTVCTEIKKNVPSAVQHIKESLERLASMPGGQVQDQEPMVNSYLGQEFRARVSQALSPKKQS